MKTRIKITTTALGAVASLLAGWALGANADDDTINRLLASQCSQCHGTHGYAVGDIDGLAGESAKDLREDLRDMKSEDAPEEMMDHQALGYTDEQIRRIANYFATLSEDAPAGLPSIRLRPLGGSGGGANGNESEDRDEDKPARAEHEEDEEDDARPEREDEKKKHHRDRREEHDAGDVDDNDNDNDNDNDKNERN